MNRSGTDISKFMIFSGLWDDLSSKRHFTDDAADAPHRSDARRRIMDADRLDTQTKLARIGWQIDRSIIT